MKFVKNPLIFIFVFTTGCASQKVNLASDPPAEVFVSSDFSSEFKSLGQTPIEVKLREVADDESFAYLTFKAEGHDNYRVVLPTNYGAGKVEVKLNPLDQVEDEALAKKIEDKIKSGYEAQIRILKDQLDQQRADFLAEKDNLRNEMDRIEKNLKEDFSSASNKIFNKVIEVQNALHLKRMSKAAKALAELRVLNAPESLVLTLEGNFEFISGKTRRALASYEKALAEDPSNVELAGILADLKKVVR